MEVSDDDVSKRWDCETILTTRSDSTNHPGKVIRPVSVAALKRKEKQQRKKLQLETVVEEESTQDEVPSPQVVFSHRPKDETPEERRERKKQTKEAQRLARESRRNVKELFRSARVQQLRVEARHVSGADVRPGVARVRL